MKDNFSVQAKLYASFRPYYPASLYDFLFKHVKNFDRALDWQQVTDKLQLRLQQNLKKCMQLISVKNNWHGNTNAQYYLQTGSG